MSVQMRCSWISGRHSPYIPLGDVTQELSLLESFKAQSWDVRNRLPLKNCTRILILLRLRPRGIKKLWSFLTGVISHNLWWMYQLSLFHACMAICAISRLYGA